MAENSKIEWTDHTFNPWIGCTKVHEGCRHCYAEADMDKRRGRVQWGPQGTRSKTSESYWKQPLRWNRQATGERPRVFCASLADVFEDWEGPILDHAGDTHWKCIDCYWTGVLPVFIREHGPQKKIQDCPNCGAACHWVRMDDLRRDLFRLIDATPRLDWLLLTKRPENIRRMWPADLDGVKRQRRNVSLLTSISDQESADKQVLELIKCRDLAPVLGLSAEPLLGPIALQQSATLACPNRTCELDPDSGHRIVQDSTEGGLWVECACSRLGGIDWVIVGGESGPNARPMHPQWARDIRDQCVSAGVPFFFKQAGNVLAKEWGCNDKKGGALDALPRDLSIRQFPRG